MRPLRSSASSSRCCSAGSSLPGSMSAAAPIRNALVCVAGGKAAVRSGIACTSGAKKISGTASLACRANSAANRWGAAAIGWPSSARRIATAGGVSRHAPRSQSSSRARAAAQRPSSSSPGHTAARCPAGSCAVKNVVAKRTCENGGVVICPTCRKSSACMVSRRRASSCAKVSRPSSNSRRSWSRSSPEGRNGRAISTPTSSNNSRQAAMRSAAIDGSVTPASVRSSASSRPPGNAQKPPKNLSCAPRRTANISGESGPGLSSTLAAGVMALT